MYCLMVNHILVRTNHIVIYYKSTHLIKFNAIKTLIANIVGSRIPFGNKVWIIGSYCIL